MDLGTRPEIESIIEQVALNKSKTHKHYNYLQRKLKQRVFTKVIKMPSCWAWARRDQVI
jgi:hypothetical protein